MVEPAGFTSAVIGFVRTGGVTDTVPPNEDIDIIKVPPERERSNDRSNMSRRKPPFRDGKVNVCTKRCSDCVFRPGNQMNLNPGRLKELVDANLKADTGLICHQTTFGQDERGEALCRGFYDQYGADVTPLRMAKALEVVAFQMPKATWAVEVCTDTWEVRYRCVTRNDASDAMDRLINDYHWGTSSVRCRKIEKGEVDVADV